MNKLKQALVSGKKIIAANLKSNLTQKESLSYLHDLSGKLACKSSCGAHDSSVVVFPSFLFPNEYEGMELGAQNCYPALSGAWTGEMTLIHLRECNIKTILIGHSERRALGEGDKLLREKFNFFAKEGLNIFYCFGEGMEVRDTGKVSEFLSKQLDIVDLSYPNLTLAYEPVWAIGSNHSINITELNEVVELIKSKGEMPLIYGGSVGLNNASMLANVCDGLLIGSASLNVDNFIKIINHTNNKTT